MKAFQLKNQTEKNNCQDHECKTFTKQIISMNSVNTCNSIHRAEYMDTYE